MFLLQKNGLVGPVGGYYFALLCQVAKLAWMFSSARVYDEMLPFVGARVSKLTQSLSNSLLCWQMLGVVVPDLQTAVMFFQSSRGTTCIRDAFIYNNQILPPLK